VVADTTFADYIAKFENLAEWPPKGK